MTLIGDCFMFVCFFFFFFFLCFLSLGGCWDDKQTVIDRYCLYMGRELSGFILLYGTTANLMQNSQLIKLTRKIADLLLNLSKMTFKSSPEIFYFQKCYICLSSSRTDVTSKGCILSPASCYFPFYTKSNINVI